MVNSNLYAKTENRAITQTLGDFSVLEYNKDLSVSPTTAENAFFCSQMNVRKKQVMACLNGNNSVICQAGAMQMMLGDVQAETGIKGVGDLFGKMLSSKVTGETAVKPKYQGNGQLILEPTYKHILLENLSDWNGSMVLDDGLFLACDGSVNITTVMRTNISSAVAGGEGLFNTCLQGQGIAVLESPVPREELIVINLQNDTVKLDGNFAIAWSNSLQFTVERTTKTLIGSAASGEGLVNVYRGTGRILAAPVG